MIVHLALARHWRAAQRAGEYRMSTLGATLDDVGFVHAAHPDQLRATAARYYSGVDEALVVLVIDPARVAVPIVEEPAAGGESFPHVYGPIPVAAVVGTRSARMEGGVLRVEGELPVDR